MNVCTNIECGSKNIVYSDVQWEERDAPTLVALWKTNWTESRNVDILTVSTDNKWEAPAIKEREN